MAVARTRRCQVSADRFVQDRPVDPARDRDPIGGSDRTTTDRQRSLVLGEPGKDPVEAAVVTAGRTGRSRRPAGPASNRPIARPGRRNARGDRLPGRTSGRDGPPGPGTRRPALRRVILRLLPSERPSPRPPRQVEVEQDLFVDRPPAGPVGAVERRADPSRMSR